MANEAVLIFETENAVPFTVADGTGIEKGALLTLSDPMTAATNATQTGMVAGIAKNEKIASDGRTKLAVYMGGIFRIFACGAIAVGEPLEMAGAVNKVRAVTAGTVSGAKVIGYALETAADNESFLMRLQISPQAPQA